MGSSAGWVGTSGAGRRGTTAGLLPGGHTFRPAASNQESRTGFSRRPASIRRIAIERPLPSHRSANLTENLTNKFPILDCGALTEEKIDLACSHCTTAPEP